MFFRSRRRCQNRAFDRLYGRSLEPAVRLNALHESPEVCRERQFYAGVGVEPGHRRVPQRAAGLVVETNSVMTVTRQQHDWRRQSPLLHQVRSVQQRQAVSASADPHQLGQRDVVLAPRSWLTGRKGVPVGLYAAAVLHTQKVEQ